MIVEQRPQDGIGEAVVMAVCYVIVKVDGLARVLLHEAFVDYQPVLGWDEETWPTNPGEVERLLESGKGRDETARRHLEVVLAMSVLGYRYRKSIGDDNEMASVHVQKAWRVFGVGRR
jgi:hypothetical protein